MPAQDLGPRVEQEWVKRHWRIAHERIADAPPLRSNGLPRQIIEEKVRLAENVAVQLRVAENDGKEDDRNRDERQRGQSAIRTE